MRPVYYQEQWEQLKESPAAIPLESLSQRIASSFIDRYYYSDEYNRDYIRLLCEMATHFSNSDFNQIATHALFGIVIERLCDNFEDMQTATYNRLICQVLNFLCEHPEGEALEAELNRFHLRTEELLYQRIESIRVSPDRELPPKINPKKILVLSRITVGADVAITSVICQRIARTFPEVAITVIGSPKLAEIFSADSGIKILELHYTRRGGLLKRFLVWLDLLELVRAEITGLSPADYLVLDPDSRLTQLGVLPLVSMHNYRFFNSRGKKGDSVKASMSELTNSWLDNILGQHDDACYPKVWLATECLTAAQSLHERLNPDGGQKLITLNLGVGGNLRKRISDNFESELILALLKESNLRVILDLGFGEEERQRNETILAAAREQGYRTEECKFDELANVSADCQLLGVQCSVGEVAALISCSDEFIGYDSACQHIAAAEGIRTFTIFSGSNDVRFIRRWRACGPNTSEIIYVDTISRDSQLDNSEVIARLMDLRQP